MNINTIIAEEIDKLDKAYKSIVPPFFMNGLKMFFTTALRSTVSKSFEAVRGELGEGALRLNTFKEGIKAGKNSTILAQRERERNFLK